MESFNELTLSPALQRAIAELGYEKPSPIQAQALPMLLGVDTDFLGLAATGTGKTAAFSIPMLERIDPSKKGVQALVLCPTRELALQVAGQINLLGKYKGIRTVAVYGGSSFGDQVYGLKQGASVVVGTPGRVIDHLDRGTLVLSGLRTVILDEADEMISMGFKDELEKILQTVPREESNIWLFSATMSFDVRRVADNYLRSPRQVQVNRKEMLPENVEQLYYVAAEHNKPEILCKLIDAASDFYGLIFCQTKVLVADLAQYLSDRGYKVDSLHGDKDQRSRERTMQLFRERKVQMLICTDVAARGLDVKDITHVVNYSIPRELDSYVHRIGRTARSGKSGVAMSLVTPANRRIIERIEHMTKSRMIQGKIPSSKDVGIKKASAILPRFLEQPNFARAMELMDPEWVKTVSEMPANEIVGRFLAMMLPDVLAMPEKNLLGRPAQNSAPRPQQQRDDSRPRPRFRRDDRREGGDDRRAHGSGYHRFNDDREPAPRSNGPRGPWKSPARY
ncbi:MAG: DEAD/DEAH box helicase [Bdellovibrionales bacterium]|nr:DEAD/DEAH box helicase [Bdellovibrionales bacterium]